MCKPAKLEHDGHLPVQSHVLARLLRLDKLSDKTVVSLEVLFFRLSPLDHNVLDDRPTQWDQRDDDGQYAAIVVEPCPNRGNKMPHSFARP
jgi:hypothetical protein